MSNGLELYALRGSMLGLEWLKCKIFPVVVERRPLEIMVADHDMQPPQDVRLIGSKHRSSDNYVIAC
jgi:hypothetical protein